MLNEKEVFGSTNPVGEIFNKIIPIEEIEYVKLREPDSWKNVGLGLLALPIWIIFINIILGTPII